MQLNLKGISSAGVGEKVSLPFSLIELLRSPWAVQVDAEELYKHGGELGRFLLSRTPIQNARKYVSTYVSLHYLQAEQLHVPTSDWHCDGSNFPPAANDIFHTMVGLGEGISGQVQTEFLKEDISLELDDRVASMNHIEFRKYMTDNADVLRLQSVPAEPGRIYTWTSQHLHRVQFATRPHFRLFWKVCESDHLVSRSAAEGLRTFSKTTLGNNGVETLNIEQGARGIILRGINMME